MAKMYEINYMSEQATGKPQRAYISTHYPNCFNSFRNSPQWRGTEVESFFSRKEAVGYARMYAQHVLFNGRPV